MRRQIQALHPCAPVSDLASMQQIVCLVMLAVTDAACYMPGRRATEVDPLEAMRAA